MMTAKTSLWIILPQFKQFGILLGSSFLKYNDDKKNIAAYVRYRFQINYMPNEYLIYIYFE